MKNRKNENSKIVKKTSKYIHLKFQIPMNHASKQVYLER